MDSRIDSNRIHDILELQRLKALYFYNLDHKDWKVWRSLFTDDAKLLVDQDDGTTSVYEGGDGLVAFVDARLTPILTVHHGHTPLFEFQSATQATGIWAMADIVCFPNTLYGYGHYREKYRKEGGVWKFASVHLTRLKVDYVAAEK